MNKLAAGFVGWMIGTIASLIACAFTIGFEDSFELSPWLLVVFVPLFSAFGVRLARASDSDLADGIHIFAYGCLIGSALAMALAATNVLSLATPLLSGLDRVVWLGWTVLLCSSALIAITLFFLKKSQRSKKAKQSKIFIGSAASKLVYLSIALHVLFTYARQSGEETLELTYRQGDSHSEIDSKFARTGWLGTHVMLTESQTNTQDYQIMGGRGLVLIGPEGSKDKLVDETNPQAYLVIIGDPSKPNSIPAKFGDNFTSLSSEKAEVNLSQPAGPALWSVGLMLLGVILIALCFDPFTAGRFYIRTEKYREDTSDPNDSFISLSK